MRRTGRTGERRDEREPIDVDGARVPLVLRSHPSICRIADEEVERILDDVGLEPRFRGKLIGTYSTGMKRRVEIARALMGRPKVLFLDEPTRGLDLPAKRDMWNLLRRLAAEENVTTFLSSHDAQEIRSLCSEISVIARGPVGLHGRHAGTRRRHRCVRGASGRAAHRFVAHRTGGFSLSHSVDFRRLAPSLLSEYPIPPVHWRTRLPQIPRNRVFSGGRCNTGFESIRWSLKSHRFS